MLSTSSDLSLRRPPFLRYVRSFLKPLTLVHESPLDQYEGFKIFSFDNRVSSYRYLDTIAKVQCLVVVRVASDMLWRSHTTKEVTHSHPLDDFRINNDQDSEFLRRLEDWSPCPTWLDLGSIPLHWMYATKSV
jgi:hypothetical protein